MQLQPFERAVDVVPGPVHGKAGDPAEVAAAVGLTDQSRLTRLFKQAYGVTPGAYRAAAAVT